VLVERDAEVAVLETIAARASAGEAQLAVVTGEAGAGKSRLLREFSSSLDDSWQTSFVRIESDATNPFSDVVGAVAAGDAPAGAIGTALGQSLARQAAGQPLALVLEDLERADPVVVRSLATVLDVLREEPVLVVAAFRLGAHPAQSDVTSALAQALRAATAHEVRLESLSDEGVAHMATAMGHRLGETELDALLARAAGNPFFVEELLHAPAGRLPWTVTEAVMQRLESLPAAAHDVARALACARDPVSRYVIEEIAPDGAAGSAALLNAGIAVAVSTDDMSLRHALTADVIDGQLSASERREWHRLLAEALEQVDGTPAARLSRHWAAAGDADRAAQYAVVAGDEATGGRAYWTAADLYRVALARPPGDELEQAQLFDRAAVAAGWAGLEREALAWATEADIRYRAAGEQWRGAAMWLNPALTHAPKPEIDHRTLAEDTIPRLLAEAREATQRREFDRAAELARRVVESSDEHSDFGALWAAAAAGRFIGAGRLREGEDILQRLRASAVASANKSLLAKVLGGIATLDASRGELTECLMVNRQAIAIARDTPQGAWAYEVGTALVFGYLGELDEATSLLEPLFEASDPMVVEFAQLPACVVDVERGELDRAWQRLERLQGVYALGVHDFIRGVLAARGRWFLRSGEHQRALDVVREADEVTGDLFEPTRVEILVLAARAAMEVGDVATLDATCEALDEAVDLAGGRGFRAAATWAHGLARARDGSLADASSLLAAGAEAFEAAGRYVYAAETWCDFARVAAQRGEDDARVRALARARDIAEPRGLRAVLDEVSGLEPQPVTGDVFDTGPLTVLSPREREITRLVAEGKTNRQIAADLFLSEYTVRNQLVNVFGKLGISRRTELARLAAAPSSPDRQ
jgi:DNA-binding CsgD family transcriptional regulator